ncbi:MAG: aldo/keto reductase [Bryobacteraceae bacterium]
MNYRTLGRTRLEISELGFGASPLGDVFGKTDPREGARAVHYAIDAGINFFDVSPYYGITLAETRLGEALEGRRHKVVLSTKCGRYGANEFDFSPKRIRASIDESLGRLRTDYVDLLLAHDIEFGEEKRIIEETVPALRQIQRDGKARFIGISGLPLKMLQRVAEAGNVDAILSYCRYNLLMNDLDSTLAPFAHEHGIGLINASPLHMGILTDAGPPTWHPAPPEVREAGARVADLCRAAGVNVETVALRYCSRYPFAATTLVGTRQSSEVEANLRALDGQTDPALLDRIETIVAPVRNRLWPTGRLENRDDAVEPH